MSLRLKAGLNGAKVFPRPTPRVFFHETLWDPPAARWEPERICREKKANSSKKCEKSNWQTGEDEKAERFSTLRSRRKLQALTTSIAE